MTKWRFIVDIEIILDLILLFCLTIIIIGHKYEVEKLNKEIERLKLNKDIVVKINMSKKE